MSYDKFLDFLQVYYWVGHSLMNNIYTEDYSNNKIPMKQKIINRMHLITMKR